MTQSAIDSVASDMATIRSWGMASPGVSAPEIDTINVLIGDGTNVLTTGIKAALHIDFNAYLHAAYIHEFDGVTGSVVIAIEKATYIVGSAPTFANIVASAPPSITSARYGANETLTGWNRNLYRNEVVRFSITSVSAFTRLLIALRVRRLEP